MAKTPPCPRCHGDAFVRAEQVISGRRVNLEYYCGRCNHNWHIEGIHTPERRQAERRARLDDAIKRLEGEPKKIARTSLRPPVGHRNAK